MEFIKEVDEFLVIKLYANQIGPKEYGDIYNSLEEAKDAHPNDVILSGYGFVEKESHIMPDWASDWYETVEEVEEDILQGVE